MARQGPCQWGWGDPVSLWASADCVRIVTESWCWASHRQSAACSRKGEIQVGQGMSRNTTTHLMLCLTCGESVAAFQIGSESVNSRQSEAGFGCWTACVGEVKVRAHQKFSLIMDSARWTAVSNELHFARSTSGNMTTLHPVRALWSQNGISDIWSRGWSHSSRSKFHC